MIKILAVSFHYDKTSPGGAAKSFLNIIEGLNRTKNFHVERLSIKSIKKILNPFELMLYLNIPKIIKTINKVKPHIILTQTGPTLATIIAARIKKTPVINIIRDPNLICPKNVNIIDYGKACRGLINKKICFDCINYWRTLRTLIGNKPKGWQYGLKSEIASIGYKIRYYLCKNNIFLFNKAVVNLVASELMKSFLSTQINPGKLNIANITPIKERKFDDKIVKKKKQLLFIIPRYDASHKGLDFILRLSEYLPNGYKIIIVGGLIDTAKIKGIKSKISNIGYITRKKIDDLYKHSEITLVPSFFTEAFGRVIIESILNQTPVISSLNCGANEFFQNKPFLKILPLNISLWIKEINYMIENPYRITMEDTTQINEMFSIEKSIVDFSNLIKQILFKRKE